MHFSIVCIFVSRECFTSLKQCQLPLSSFLAQFLLEAVAGVWDQAGKAAEGGCGSEEAVGGIELVRTHTEDDEGQVSSCGRRELLIWTWERLELGLPCWNGVGRLSVSTWLLT